MPISSSRDRTDRLKRARYPRLPLGRMVAQQVALERPSLVHKMLLVATAPEGGEDIMHMDKPELRKITEDPNMPGMGKLVKLFFAPSESSQAAGEVFAARLAERKQDGEPLAGQNVAIAQITAFRAWEQYSGERFAKLGKITQLASAVSFLTPFRNQETLTIAHDLDDKIVKLLNDAAVEQSFR